MVDVTALPDQPVIVTQLREEDLKQLGTVGGLLGEASAAQGHIVCRTTI
jgi:hypothetical protein